MKKYILITASLFLLAACNSQQKQFCTNAAENLCGKCAACGASYAPCGLAKTTTKSECVEQLQRVCAAYDSLYTVETANACLEQLQSLDCDTLKASGKPDICTRLF